MDFECSTPFGITDHFTVSSLSPHFFALGAQRLSASQTISPSSTLLYSIQSQGAQRLSASQTISLALGRSGLLHVEAEVCSTPFGITDHFTILQSNLIIGLILKVLNAFRHHRPFHAESLP